MPGRGPPKGKPHSNAPEGVEMGRLDQGSCTSEDGEQGEGSLSGLSGNQSGAGTAFAHISGRG